MMPKDTTGAPTRKPAVLEALRFLTALDAFESKFTFQTFSDAAKGAKDPLARIIHGTLEGCLTALEALSSRGAGVFVCVSATDLKGRTDDNFVRVRAVWAELDDGMPATPFPLEPSMLVESSPGRFHAYWLVEGLSADEHSGVIERMVESWGSDKGAKGLVRVMRLPGFLHQKDPAKPFQVRIASLGGQDYSRDEVLVAFPPVARARAVSSPAMDREVPPLDVVRSALGRIPADDRATWQPILAGLKLDYGVAGRSVGREWSMTCPEKFSEGDFEEVWSSHVREDGNVATGRKILWLARENGWVDTRLRQVGENELPSVAPGEVPHDALSEPPPKAFRRTDYAGMAEAWLRGRHVVRWSDWLEYRDGAYRAVDDEQMTGDAWRWLRRQRVELKDGDGPLDPNKAIVANVIEAATSQRRAPGAPPCWLEPREGDPDPADVVSMANGILDTRTRQLMEPTPRFLTLHTLPFPYDPEATCFRWLSFLEEVWPEERDQREALREIFGYMLGGWTWLQKAFFIHGGRRSGKGTIGRVLIALIGEWNFCGPTAKTMGGDFGLQSFIGKLLALVSDMRIGKGTDHTTMVENVLRVSGEDGVTVQRKNKEDWIGWIRARFLILSNRLLQVRDESGAFLGRMVVLRIRVSFFGREDTTLTDKLKAELPGIFNWALDGMDYVRAFRTIEQPESARGLVELMRSSSSPVCEFVAERCDLGPKLTCTKAELWSAFEAWAASRSLHYTGTNSHFFIDLYEAVSDLDQWGNRYSKLKGLSLRSGSG